LDSEDQKGGEIEVGPNSARKMNSEKRVEMNATTMWQSNPNPNHEDAFENLHGVIVVVCRNIIKTLNPNPNPNPNSNQPLSATLIYPLVSPPRTLLVAFIPKKQN
jgi:hypothetical protein